MAQETAISAPIHRKVPMKTRIMWGCGGAADNFMFNVFNYLYLWVYVDYFKMNPALAGIAVAIPRFIDAVTDPIIGNWSDNFRSKWGRRRPLIIVGTICCAILLPLFWVVPFVSTAQNAWYCNAPFFHLVTMGCIYACAYTLFVVPFTALGFELSDNYDERTRVLSWRMYIGLIAQAAVPWVYKFSVNETLFCNIQQGAIIVTCVMSVLVIILGFMPALGCKERPEGQHQPKISLLKSVIGAFSNKVFLRICCCEFIVILIFGMPMMIGSFVSLYVVCLGDQSLNANIVGINGSLGSITCMVSLAIFTFLSQKLNKRSAVICGFIYAAVCYGTLWFTLDPRWPYAQVVSYVFIALATQGCWLMIDSMMSDICDDDELITGMRREGIFSSVLGFIKKSANAMTAVLAGLMLEFSGFSVETAKTVGLSDAISFRMKAIMVLCPVIAFLFGAILMYKYPISRERAARTRLELDRRHATGK